MKWTCESAITSVRDFHAKHGYQPVSREARQHYGLPSFAQAVRLFGSWNALIEAAGFSPYPARSSSQAKTMAHRDRRNQNEHS